MLKKEKELFMAFVSNPNNLKGLTVVFAFFLFGIIYTYYNIETTIEDSHLTDVYATNPQIQNGGVGQPSYLSFRSKNEKEITFRITTNYLSIYDRYYLLSFDKKDKLYKLKVKKNSLGNAENGDAINLYSISDDEKNYLTFEQYRKKKKTHYSKAFQVSVLFASMFLVWIILLLVKKKRITAP